MPEPHAMLNRRARAFSASDRDVTAFEGVVVGLWEGPVLSIITETGAMECWLAALVEEVEPGSGDVGVQSADYATHTITIDSPEDYCTLEHGPHGDVEAMTADPRTFPSPAWSVALDRVMENFDAATCDMSHLDTDTGKPLCSNAIGWVLYEDDDEPHRSGTSWRQTNLVYTLDGIAAVCEDCAPDTIYSAAATGARVERERQARENAKARIIDPTQPNRK